MSAHKNSLRGAILFVGLSFGMPAFPAVTLDGNFGNLSGFATISQGGMISDNARDVAVDADGKIVLVGHVDQPPVSSQGNNFALAFARLTVNGLPDNSFSGDGRLYMSTCAPSAIGPGGTSNPKLALQADGKILAGATCVGPLYEQIVLVRLNSDGSLDNSFDDDGVLYLPAPTVEQGSRFGDIAVQADGKILVSGTVGTMNANVRHGVVLRLNATGTTDTTFATQGRYTGGDRTNFLPLALMSDGRVMVAGYTSAAGAATTDVVVTRLLAGGAPDNTFGTQGVVVRNVGVLSAPFDPDFATMDFANALAVRPDGRVLVGGTSRDMLGSPRYEPMVMQLKVNGGLDTGWGQDGFISLGGVSGDPSINTMYLLPAGDLLLGGFHIPFTHVDSAGLARSNSSMQWEAFGIDLQNGNAVIANALGDPSFDFRAMRFAFTADSDLVPNVLPFGNDFIEPLGTPRQSNSVTVTGINSSAAVSTVNGEFSIACTGTFVPAGESRLIQNNATLCLRHTTPETSNSTITTTLTVGDISVDWSSTTGDGTPDGLAFTSQSNVATSTVVNAPMVTVTGINMPVRITISGGEYSVGCTNAFTNNDSTIINNQTLCVRHTSAAAASSVATTNIRVGDFATSFTSTTAPAAPPAGGGSSGGSSGGGGGGAIDAWLLAALLSLLSWRALAWHRAARLPRAFRS